MKLNTMHGLTHAISSCPTRSTDLHPQLGGVSGTQRITAKFEGGVISKSHHTEQQLYGQY